MAWNRLQSKSASSSTLTASVTLGSALTGGSKLIAFVACANNTAPISTVKDGNNNSFTQLTGVTTNQDLYVFVCDIATSTTITATSTGTANGMAILVMEVTGLATGTTTAACYDGTAGTSNGSTVISSGGTSLSLGAYTSTVANEFLVIVHGDGGDTTGTTTTLPSGYTADANNISSDSNDDLRVWYKNSTGGTESPTTITDACTSNATLGWASVFVAFNLGAPAVAGGISQARPGKTWRRRFYHPQQLIPPYQPQVYQVFAVSGTVGTAITVPVPTSPGDAIAVTYNTGVIPSSVSDSQGNTYQPVSSVAADFTGMLVATYNGSPGTPTKALAAGVDTITFNGSASAGGFTATGVRQIAPNVLDAAPTAIHYASTTAPTGPATGVLPQAGDVILYALLGANVGTVVTWTAPFTGVVNWLGTTGEDSLVAWTVDATAATVTPASTVAPASLQDAFTVALAPAGTPLPPMPGSSPQAFPGRTWQRRFHHRQILPPAPVTGATTNFLTLTGTASASGTQTIQAGVIKTGTATASGTVKRSINSNVTGLVTAIGAMPRRVNIIQSGLITAIGNVKRSLGIHQSVVVTVSGTLAILKTKLITLTGLVTVSGTQKISIGKITSGLVTATGNINRNIGTHIAGLVTVSGTLTAIKTKLFTLTTSVTVSATQKLQVGTHIVGLVTASASQKLSIGKIVTGLATVTGAIKRSIGAHLAGLVTVSGTLTTVRVKLLTLLGTVTASAVQKLQIGSRQTGTATASGAQSVRLSVRLAGTATALGTRTARVARTLLGTATASGTLTAQKVILLTLSGVVTATGTIRRGLRIGISGSITAFGTVRKRIPQFLRGVVTAIPGISISSGALMPSVLESDARVTGTLGSDVDTLTLGSEARVTNTLGSEVSRGN